MADEQHENDEGRPSLRQRLHAATGDRDAEAKSLVDETDGAVDEDDAKIAVQRAHGEAGADTPMPVEDHPDEELARPSDVEAVHEERVDDTGS